MSHHHPDHPHIHRDGDQLVCDECGRRDTIPSFGNYHPAAVEAHAEQADRFAERHAGCVETETL